MRNGFRIVLAAIVLSTGFLADCNKGTGPATQPAVEPKAAGQLEASKVSGTLMGLQYEPYFTNLNVGWETNQATGIPGLIKGTQEAIPILGKYSSYDVNLIRKHEEWFEYLGIDWLLIDWTNFLIAKPGWETQDGPTHEVEQTTELLFKTYRQLCDYFCSALHLFWGGTPKECQNYRIAK